MQYTGSREVFIIKIVGKRILGPFAVHCLLVATEPAPFSYEHPFHILHGAVERSRGRWPLSVKGMACGGEDKRMREHEMMQCWNTEYWWFGESFRRRMVTYVPCVPLNIEIGSHSGMRDGTSPDSCRLPCPSMAPSPAVVPWSLEAFWRLADFPPGAVVCMRLFCIDSSVSWVVHRIFLSLDRVGAIEEEEMMLLDMYCINFVERI